ncbi:NAD(P)H-dependent flavin oxidoreductase [Arthrobacter globiformis]|uniref:NAD(P)H-dependent flavin oxidoreductase n=1 Tax=Arthrobacter globiformis TaxID=1665 RepID=UPI000B40EAAA|nr:nitronate monooxygenase [Arthrobacter globiformis]
MPLADIDTRIIAAPMAGGTSTPGFVTAVHRAGGLGFLAAGYKSADAVSAEIRSCRDAGSRFGVNVFVPDPAQLNPSPDAVARLEKYRSSLGQDAARYDVTVPPLVLDDDDAWQAKIDLLLQDPVELVSFAFGLPDSPVVQALRKAGATVLATVTSRAEAELAAERGVDGLVVQHSSAGAHSGAFLPAAKQGGMPASTADLIREVRAAVDLPLIAAGAVSDAATVRAVIDAGAVAAQVGTALLRTDESGARQLHKDALGDERFTDTVPTRAFTGRYARALVNDFVRDHGDAPEGYPAIHHLTAPIRAAAAAAGDDERLNLWAGKGWRSARTGPVATAIGALLD